MFPNDESDTASNTRHKSLDHDKSSFLIIKREQLSQRIKKKKRKEKGEKKKKEKETNFSSKKKKKKRWR